MQVSDGSLVPINVPNVVGLDRTTADANIIAASLTVGTPIGVVDAAPINQVVSQTPGDCTGCALIGSAVDYNYSIGLPVGNYVGLQQAVGGNRDHHRRVYRQQRELRRQRSAGR